MVKAVGEARQNPIAQWLFTPFTGDMSEDAVLMTAWPSFASMGTTFKGSSAKAQAQTSWWLGQPPPTAKPVIFTPPRGPA